MTFHQTCKPASWTLVNIWHKWPSLCTCDMCKGRRIQPTQAFENCMPVNRLDHLKTDNYATQYYTKWTVTFLVETFIKLLKEFQVGLYLYFSPIVSGKFFYSTTVQSLRNFCTFYQYFSLYIITAISIIPPPSCLRGKKHKRTCNTLCIK